MRELTQQHYRNPPRVDFSTQPVRSLSIILRASLPATDVHSCLQVIMAALEAAAIGVYDSEFGDRVVDDHVPLGELRDGGFELI